MKFLEEHISEKAMEKLNQNENVIDPSSNKPVVLDPKLL
jgi:hypothetical protein